MSTNPEGDKEGTDKKKEGVSRRQFITGLGAGIIGGAVVGAGIGALGFPETITKTVTQNQTQTVTQTETAISAASGLPSNWDLNADVVVIGGGGAGLPAALAAKAKGASVIVVDMNYDLGGHAICSGGTVDLGAGTSAQQRAGVNDSPDLLLQDLCLPEKYVPGTGLVWGTWSGPWQDRAMAAVFANNNVAAFNFLVQNGIQFQDVVTTAPVNSSHWHSASATPRSNVPMWKGIQASANPAGADNPAGNGGVGYARPLELTARSNGVQFLLNYRMSQVYRAQPYSGKVVGISANYTGGRVMPGSTSPLQPYATQGNMNMTQATVNIKANNGVIIATGGSSSSVDRRRRIDPRLFDTYQVAGEPYSYQTGDGEYAAQRVGASLWATANETSEYGGGFELTHPGRLGCQYGYNYLHWVPASPVFPLARAGGLSVTDYQDIINVDMAGERFADETQTSYQLWMDPALAMNSASQPPEYKSGPTWAIFDSDAVTREGWTLGTPNTDPLFFYQANDIPTLVQQINTNQYQTNPMSATALQNTITKYNSFVTSGVDSDFGKPSPKYQIATPPFYAGFFSVVIHDWLTGVRIDSGAHVLDLDANAIPGLYAAGESVGGMEMHGLAKCAVFGMIAGANAATGS